MSFNSLLVKAYAPTGSVIALNGKTSGQVAAGPSIAIGGANNVELDSLVANVSAALTTNTITATPRWEVSQDNITFVPLVPQNGAANVSPFAAGTGGLVTTAVAQALPINASYPYVRLSIVVGVVTGAAGDNVTVTYNWRKRFMGPS